MQLFTQPQQPVKGGLLLHQAQLGPKGRHRAWMVGKFSTKVCLNSESLHHLFLSRAEGGGKAGGEAEQEQCGLGV